MRNNNIFFLTSQLSRKLTVLKKPAKTLKKQRNVCNSAEEKELFAGKWQLQNKHFSSPSLSTDSSRISVVVFVCNTAFMDFLNMAVSKMRRELFICDLGTLCRT